MVDNPTSIASGVTNAVTTSTVPTTTTTTVVAVTPVSTTSGTTTGTTSATTSTTTTTTPVVLQSSTGTTLNATQSTVTTSSGTAVSVTQVSQSGSATLAASAASAASTAAASLSTLVTNNSAITSTQLSPEVSSASTAFSGAQSAFNSANALTIDTATATSKASAVQTVTTSATTAYNANGQFADATLATPAKTAMVVVNGDVQSALAQITSLAADLGSYKTAGGSLLTSASSALTMARSALSTLTSLNLSNTTAQAQLSLAQSAALASQTAASLAQSYETAGDFISAQAQLTIAQNQQTIAVNALSAANSVISGVLAARQSSSASGSTSDSSVSPTTVFGNTNAAQMTSSSASSLASFLDSSKATVDANAPIAQYSNPAIASPPDGWGFLTLGSKAVGTLGWESVISTNRNSQPGDAFVLDGAKSLVHVRNAEEVKARGFNYTDTTTDTTTSNVSEYIKFTGTSADTYKAPDNSIYIGRIQGGAINTYSDTGTSGGAALLESISLGNNSLHYIVFENPSLNSVQKLIGTANYSVVASTKPTDMFGNVGTLNAASTSITADFSSQTAKANVNLSFSGSRVMTLNATTPYVPLSENAFESNTSMAAALRPTITCSGSGCTFQSPTGTVDGTLPDKWRGGVGGGFGGTNSSVGALGYQFTPNLGVVPANTPLGDLIQGVVALQSGSAPEVGVNPTPVVSAHQYRAQLIYPIQSNNQYFLAGVNGGIYANTAFVNDANGNLVRMLGALWNALDLATPSQCSGQITQCLNSPTSASDTTSIISMGGGVLGAKGLTFDANGDKVLATAGMLTETYVDAVNGISFGRYQGGLVNASAQSNQSNDVLTPLLSNSVVWATREVPVTIPVSGVFHYTPTFATAPADNLGNVGSVNRARLAVNFGTQTVNPEVSVKMNDNLYLRAWAQDVPLSTSTFGFNVSSGSSNAQNSPASVIPLQVACLGSDCAPPPVGSTNTFGYGGRISGGLAGDNLAGGALFRYTFNTYYDSGAAIGATGGIPSGAQAPTTVSNYYVNGLVGFKKGPEATPASNANGSQVATSFFLWPNSPTSSPMSMAFGSNDIAVVDLKRTAATGTTSDGSGNLTSAADYDPANSHPNYWKLSGTLSPSPTTPVTLSATGISFGRYAGSTVSLAQTSTTSSLLLDGSLNGIGPFGPTSSNSTTLSENVLGTFHWIKGPELWPFYITSILKGSATFSLSGASPATDQNNVTNGSQLGGGTATFNVNFDKQSVDVALSNIVVPANSGVSLARTWNASATDIALDGDGTFWAQNTGGANPKSDRTIAVTMTTIGASTSSPQSGYGTLAGAFTGNGGVGATPAASGVVLSYGFAANDANNFGSNERVNGVVAFKTPTFTNSASYTSTAALATQPYILRLSTSGTTSGFDSTTGVIRGGAISDRAFAISADSLVGVQGEAIDPGSIKFNSAIQPVAFDGVSRVVAGSNCPNISCYTQPIPTYVSFSSSALTTAAGYTVPAVTSAATVADFSRDHETGMMWGRYAGGNMVVVDRITGAVLNGGAQFSAGNNRHFIYSDIQSGPTVLPVTGTVTYNFIGGTNPTDQSGVGTLNSATLVANFTAATVNLGVNASVNGNTWAASASAVPIQKGVYFEAARQNGAGPLNLTCTGGTGCTGVLTGKVIGGFTGPTGQGAAIAYSFNASTFSGSNITSVGQTVTGVAAFKR